MNTLISILLAILLLILLLPITPKWIYMLKNKNKDPKLAQDAKDYFLMYSIGAILFWILLIIYFISTNSSIIDILGLFIIVPFIRLIIFLVFIFSYRELNIPKKVKYINAIFILAICTISCFIGISSDRHYNKIQNCITNTIPEEIVNYAEDNNYILFVDSYTNFESEFGNKDIMFFDKNNNGTHYLLIEKGKKENIILVNDIYHPENSFTAEYDTLFELDEKAFVKEYAEIIDNVNRGSNYAPVCYLVNEENISIIYGLAKKDKDTKEFYVSKYVIFDMTTGKFSDL